MMYFLGKCVFDMLSSRAERSDPEATGEPFVPGLLPPPIRCAHGRSRNDRTIWLICALYIFTLITPAWADPQPLPRFAALRAKAAHTHVGPGNQYPLEWRYVRQYLPVEVVAEFDTWRQIRDAEGAVGWVHKSLLTGKRYVMVLQKTRKLFHKADIKADVRATLEPGTIGRLLECRQDWCRVDIQGHRGWIRRRFLWGVYPHEEQVR